MALPFVIGSSETVHYIRNGHDHFQVTVTDILGEKGYDFKLNETFVLTYGPDDMGKLHTNCTLPEFNHMRCISIEKTKGWTLIDDCYYSHVSDHFIDCIVRKLSDS